MFLLNVLLALAWVAMTGEFTPANFLVGFVLSYLMLWVAQRSIGPSTYFARVRRTLAFAFFVWWKLTEANLRVAWQVLSPQQSLRPAVIAVPLAGETDLEIVFLANLLTLTPGSLTLDISDDRRVLYVHIMQVEDVEQTRQEIKEGFERRVLELLR